MPPGDASAISAALRVLLDDPTRLEECGRRAREFAERERSEARMLESVDSVYRAVVARREHATR